ncbi:MAG: EAL domain-containing protein [Chloroflexota bacterium]|nr:EAL domain-containing protein [Chloroflexota bacterium]
MGHGPRGNPPVAFTHTRDLATYRGGLITGFSDLVPAAFRDLSAGTRTLITAGLAVLVLLMAQVAVSPAADSTFWIRVELTFAAALASAIGLASIRGTTGRVRAVRGWITAGMGLWLLGELIRSLEWAAGVDALPALSDVPFVGVLVCSSVAYSAALRGQLRPGEVLAVYLDGAIVFFATAALMVTLFSDVAGSSMVGTVDLVYAIFFLATTGATLLLDMAVRAERRAHGAYVVLVGLVLLGGGFLMRLMTAPTGGPHEAGASTLLALGVVVVGLGTATWTDTVDDAAGYVRVAARVRAGMPLVAVGLTPVLIAAHFLRDLSGPIGVVNLVAIGLVLISVAVRQSVMLGDRETAVRREQELSRELSGAERKYRSLIERQPGVVYVAEPGPAGRWSFVSPQVESMLGYAPKEWLADPELWARSIHPDDRDAVLASDLVAADVGTAKRFEYRMIRRDGRIVWVLDDVAVTETPGQPALLQGLLVDITPAKVAEDALRTSEEQQRMIIETASYAFVAIDSQGRVVEWNRQAEATFGWSRVEAMGADVAQLIIPAAQHEAHHEGMRRFAATGDGPILSRRMELEAVHRDGHAFPVELTIWPVKIGESTRFNALIDDITVRKELEGQLRHQALHDSLTGLPNRALFTDRVQHALERSTRDVNSSLAVIFLDLDDFKNINDSLGHGAGDELLGEVGARLGQTLRPADTAARLGGDEFAVLLEDATTEAPQIVAARLLEAFEQPFTLHGKQVHVRASIGIATDTSGTSTPEDLLRNADLAMYMAKQRGKGRYELYEQRMHEAAVRRLDLKADLERAIADERLEVHYQPIVELHDGTVTGFEALLRWRDPHGQFVPVPEIISLAEETGLIIPIGRFVLREACRQAVEWADLGTTPMHVAVNVSALQLEHGSVVRDVRAALRQSGLEPSALVIEITESSLIDDSLSARRELRALRKLGVRMALDDFGTGYSSLGRLRHLPFDIVKIDRSFVSRVTEEQEGAVVQSILEMASTMGLEVVAEGIETQAQLLALRARGCRFGQGFYYSRAVPPEAIESVLAVGRLPIPRRRLQALPARGA